VKAGQEEIKNEIRAASAGQENMKTTISAKQEKLIAGQKELQAAIKANHEKMDVAISAVRSAETEFKESINRHVEGILASVDQPIQGLAKDLEAEIQETQSDVLIDDGVSG
jgi:Skp family chaperone for outer membrane proteins